MYVIRISNMKRLFTLPVDSFTKKIVPSSYEGFFIFLSHKSFVQFFDIPYNVSYKKPTGTCRSTRTDQFDLH